MGLNLTLQERLKKQYQGEKEIIQNLTQQGLNDIRKGLISTLQQERDIMQKDINQALQKELEKLNGLLKKHSETKKNLLLSVFKNRILLPFLSTASVLAVILMSGWGLSTYQESQISANWQAINAQKDTLVHLEKRTGGMDIIQNKDGLFVVLPEGTKVKDNWTMGNKKALKITR